MYIRTSLNRLLSTLPLLWIGLLASCGPTAAAPGPAGPAAPAPAVEKRDLVVGIHPSPPFVVATDNGGWSGLSVELWRLMAEKAGLSYRFAPMELGQLFDALGDGTIDIAVGALSMTAEREQRLDFSHPYLITGLGIAAPVQPDSPLRAALARLVSHQLGDAVGLVVLWLLVSGALVWLFERRHNPAMFGGDRIRGIGSGVWWALVTLTTVGYGDKAPITVPGRIVAAIWMIASLVILSSLTAAIASSLTVNTLTSTISGPADLPGKRVATVSASISAVWLRDHGIGFQGYPRLEQALDALENHQVDAVVYDAPILNLALKARGNPDFRLLDHRFEQTFNAFALPQHSPELETLNQAILKTIRGERWRRLRNEFLGTSD